MGLKGPTLPDLSPFVIFVLLLFAIDLEGEVRAAPYPNLPLVFVVVVLFGFRSFAFSKGWPLKGKNSVSLQLQWFGDFNDNFLVLKVVVALLFFPFSYFDTMTATLSMSSLLLVFLPLLLFLCFIYLCPFIASSFPFSFVFLYFFFLHHLPSSSVAPDDCDRHVWLLF